MTLPDWETVTEEQRRDFTQWVLEELDRRDDAIVADGSSPLATEIVEARLAMVKLAKKAGLRIAAPKRPVGAPKKAPRDHTDFDWAALDVPRIRAIFTRHWGKRNRLLSPMAEDIAAERWELSAADTVRLKAKFQRRS